MNPDVMRAGACLGEEPACDLSRYRADGFDRGASRWKEAAWQVFGAAVFGPAWLKAYGFKAALLRRFGATVGAGAVLKPGVRIALPWRLRMGDHVWLGEACWLQALAPIEIGSHVCISQGVWLFTGSHDASDPAFGLVTKPIRIEDGVWIGARAFVAAGVTVGRNAVIGAGSVVVRDMPAGMFCAGNPCRPIAPRTKGAPASPCAS